AEAERRRLVCYDCGVACDLSRMRNERIVFLRKMGAVEAARSQPTALDSEPDGPECGRRPSGGLPDGPECGRRPSGGLPDGPECGRRPSGGLPDAASHNRNLHRPERFRPLRPGGAPVRYRLRYAKTGPAALLGHLDLMRELARTLRRAG